MFRRFPFCARSASSMPFRSSAKSVVEKTLLRSRPSQTMIVSVP